MRLYFQYIKLLTYVYSREILFDEYLIKVKMFANLFSSINNIFELFLLLIIWA